MPKTRINHRNLIQAGFELLGETYTKGNLSISMYADEDRLDTYTLHESKIEYMDQINENGIFTKEQSEKEHKTSYRLARRLPNVLPANKMVIDLGCGNGEYIKRLKNFRYKVQGYEGQPLKDAPEFIKKQDITKQIKGVKRGSVLCLEVMEHIPAKLEKKVLANIKNACNGRLILSWGIEGQGGCGHVNERNANYVIPTIEKLGFSFKQDLSQELRDIAGADLPWFKNSIYVFDKTKAK